MPATRDTDGSSLHWLGMGAFVLLALLGVAYASGFGRSSSKSSAPEPAKSARAPEPAPPNVGAAPKAIVPEEPRAAEPAPEQPPPEVVPEAPQEPAPVAANQATSSREAILKQMRATQPRVSACYEDGLKRDPTLAGLVEVKFTIGPTGSVPVAATTPKTTLADSNVQSCILRIIKGLNFPPPPEGMVNIVYPLKFGQ
jgi:hypothetical protein